MSVRRASEPVSHAQKNPLLLLKASSGGDDLSEKRTEFMELAMRSPEKGSFLPVRHNNLLSHSSHTESHPFTLPASFSPPPTPLCYLPRIQDGTDEFPSAAGSARSRWPMEERSLLRERTTAQQEEEYIKYSARLRDRHTKKITCQH